MQPKGWLTVVGSLDIRQFWPATQGIASSDGDTVHLKVDPAASFLFSPSSQAKPKPTTAFTGAYVIDHGKRNRVITSKSAIKIRLQGIDTPELHYPVLTAWHESKKGRYANEFRQPYGAGAAHALHDYLQGFSEPAGDSFINATFVTQIDRPGAAIDSHGRFVGDILVGTSAGKSINTWLVENGWAFPLFYESMTGTEVQTLVSAWERGRKITARPGKSLQKTLRPFDPAKNVKNAKLPDRGKVNIPKIFRRQATFWTQVEGPLIREEFVVLLKKGQKGKADAAYPREYFLANIDTLNPKKRVKLADMIGPQGQTLFKPEDLVFREDPSTLWRIDGTKVTRW